MKTCACCKEILSLSNFTKNVALKDGLSHYCRTCVKAHWKKHSHKKKINRLKKRYGISEEAYMALYQSQCGQCKICHSSHEPFKGLHVDHCHETNKVRGLLCNECNHVLGAAKDNILTLQRAIAYLIQ